MFLFAVVSIVIPIKSGIPTDEPGIKETRDASVARDHAARSIFSSLDSTLLEPNSAHWEAKAQYL